MAQENNQNNSNDPMVVLKTPILILILLVALSGVILVNKTIPSIKSLSEVKSTYTQTLNDYNQKEQKLETLKAAQAASSEVANNATSADASGDKALFKSVESGSDTESLIAAEFNEILSLMTSNQIKTRAVKYTYDPEDDNFVKGAKERFSVCKLDMEMIASYTNFKNFMKDLYKHDHYLDIAKVEIVPYKKNKNILLINFQLKLYAEHS